MRMLGVAAFLHKLAVRPRFDKGYAILLHDVGLGGAKHNTLMAPDIQLPSLKSGNAVSSLRSGKTERSTIAVMLSG